MSEFLEDGGLFLREATLRIAPDMSRDVCIQAAFNLSLGVERILKEVLWRVNPLYVLVNPAFKNSMPVLYESQILQSERKSAELASDPDGDVLTFRNSLVRASTCSRVTLDNKALLFQLAFYRDVIAHHRLSMIDDSKLRMLLQRDSYPLIHAYADELKCKLGSLLGGKDIKLAKLSAQLQDDVEKALALLMDGHGKTWKQLKVHPGFIAEKERITREILGSECKAKFKCPACGNIAVIYGRPEVEYNPTEKHEIAIGVRVTKLKCQFCKLELTDYKYIDHLGLSKVLAESVASTPSA